jgi:hypothetical protein
MRPAYIESELTDVRRLLAEDRLVDACGRCAKLVRLAPTDSCGWKLAVGNLPPKLGCAQTGPPRT